jgi:hypothetical protein
VEIDDESRLFQIPLLVTGGVSSYAPAAHPLCFSRVNSTAISDALHSYRFCTMGAAVEGSICLYTMPNDLAAAVFTGRSKSGDGAFKAVEHVRPTSHEHLKGLIVLVAAYFTLCHRMIPFL